MTAQHAQEQGGLGHVILVGLLAWVVPGGGYWALGDRRRALVVGITIGITFLLGLYIGSIGVVDPMGARYWYAAQVMTTPVILGVGHFVSSVVSSDAYTVYGRPSEIGQIYTSIAGLLNLLCIINAAYLAHLRQPLVKEKENPS
jgi:hypothetical protein